MKKKLAVLMGVVSLAASLCACGEKTLPQENTTESVENVVNEVKESEDTEEVFAGIDSTEDLADLTYRYTENRFGYSINILPYYHTEAGYGYVSYEGDMSFSEVIYITQYSGEVGDQEQSERIDMSEYEDSTDIFDLLIGNIDLELFGGRGFSLVDYDVEAIETQEINGVEMTKFEGTLTAYYKYVDENYTYPIVAYGIKSAKTPILVCCIDRTKDRSSHETWVDKIDVMISTFQDGE